MTLTMIIRCQVLVIVRVDSPHTPLLDPGSSRDVEKVVRQLRESFNSKGINGNTNTTLQKILARLCRINLDQRFAAKEANDVYLGHFAVTAAFLGDWPLFEEARKKTLKAWEDDSWFALGGPIDLQDPAVGVDE